MADIAPMTAVNVALGGGGAKGLVHLGVLQALVENDIEIRSVVGTSIGALVGALFAYNIAVRFKNNSTLEAQRRSVAALQDLFLKTDFRRFRDVNLFSAFRKGLLKGCRIEDWLKMHLYDEVRRDGIRFVDLPFDLTVTATNAENGECLVLNRDNSRALHIHSAVRASISIQWFFRDVSVELDGRSLRCWDGGTTGNCRVDIAHSRDPRLVTVASSVTYRGSTVSTSATILSAWLRVFRIMSHSTSILMRQLEEMTKASLSSSDRQRIVWVYPNLGGVQTLDFGISATKKRELFQNGRIAMEQAARDFGLI